MDGVCFGLSLILTSLEVKLPDADGDRGAPLGRMSWNGL